MNSVTPTCPRCAKVIPDDDVNVAKGVAFCRRCHLLHDLNELLEGAELDFAPELEAPPAGTWLREEGFSTVVGATHRSFGQVIGVFFAMLFCNGIVSVFVSMATIDTLQNFGVPLPLWLHLFTSQGGKSNLPHGGGLLFLWLFLTPFIVIGLILIVTFFSSLFGRTEVRLGEAEGAVRVAIGPFGWRRWFDPTRVRSVKIAPGMVTKNNQPQNIIRLESEGRRPLKFGSLLREDRKRFVAAQVNRLLRAKMGRTGAPTSNFSLPTF